MSRHTYAVFGAVFTLALCAALSVLCVFYFTSLFVLVYLWAVLSALLSFNDRELPEYRLSRLAISVVFPFFSAVFFFIARCRVRDSPVAEVRREGALTAEGIDGAFVGAVNCLLRDDATAEVFANTECEYFSDTEKMLSSMLRDISDARRSVYLEYYIISEGRVLTELIGRLRECALRGVDVRIVFDDLGSMLRLSRGFLRRLTSYGIRVAVFSPLGRGIGRGNNRDHRKLLTVDGRVAYVGGMNISDEYIGKSKRFGLWRDMGVRLFGDCALGFEKSFLRVFHYCENQRTAPIPKDSAPTLKDGAPPLNDIARSTQTERDTELIATESHSPTPQDGSRFVSFSSAPKPFGRAQAGKRLLLNIIDSARSHVLFTTPYLIPDYQLTEAMSRAVGRGVRIAIVTPGVADKRLIKIITESFYPALVAAGVEIYEYPTGFLHGKCTVCDGKLALVGSLNLDYRSLAHNFENGVLILGKADVAPIEHDIDSLIQSSQKIGKGGKNHGVIKKTVRLLSGAVLPIL